MPFLNRYEGALWKEDLPGRIDELLNQEMPLELLEIIIKPEDSDGHHWGLEYYVLTEINDKLYRAIDIQKSRERSLAKKQMFFLTHDQPDIFSAYGIPVKANKKYLVGLLMVDRPVKVREDWLNEVYGMFGELTLMTMSRDGDRGIFCQMEIQDNSLVKVVNLDSEIEAPIKNALFRYMYELPKPHFKMHWNPEDGIWKSEAVRNEV